jgi:hypothetical protein
MQEQHELYENARKRTKQKKRLYLHFVVFVVGSLFLFIMDRVLGVGRLVCLGNIIRVVFFDTTFYQCFYYQAIYGKRMGTKTN